MCSKGEAEEMQGLLQEDVGGQTRAEQHNKCVEWNEENHWVQGNQWRQPVEPEENKWAKQFLQQV